MSPYTPEFEEWYLETYGYPYPGPINTLEKRAWEAWQAGYQQCSEDRDYRDSR